MPVQDKQEQDRELGHFGFLFPQETIYIMERHLNPYLVLLLLSFHRPEWDVLGVGGFRPKSIVNYEDMAETGLYNREPSTGTSGSNIPIGWDGTYLCIAHFRFMNGCYIDIATVYNHSKYWIGFSNDWREL